MANFLGLILALLPVYLWRFNIAGFPTTALEILIVVFLLVVLIKIKKPDLEKIKILGRINYAVGLFVLAGIISTIVSPEPIKALGQLKAFIIEPVLLFYASVLVIKNQGQCKTILKYLFVAASLISLFGLIQYLTHTGLPLRFWGTGLEPKRITSFFEYPNALALYLGPLFIFFTVIFSKKEKYIPARTYPFGTGGHKYILLPGLILLATALVLTLSRGVAIAVGLALLILAFKTFPAKKISLAGVILLLILIVSPLRERLLISDASSLTHAQLWQEGIRQIKTNPIFGNGLHGFAAYNVEYPHNIILNLWLELGLLGLTSFGAVIYFCWNQYKKKPSELKLAGMMFLLVLIVHGLVDVPYFKNDLAILFWFMTSLFYIPE